MKFQLNFIGDRVVTYRLKVLRRIIFAGLLLGFTLCAVAMGYLYINNGYEIKDCQNELASILKDSSLLDKEVFKIVEYRKEWDSLYEKISLITELTRKKIWWTPKLEALSRVIPDNIWLSKISIQLSRKEASGETSSSILGSLILEGFAQPGDSEGFHSLQNFTQELREDSAFSKILGEINLTTTIERKGWGPTVDFWLSCPLVKEEGL